jgi:hypothetical protein
VQGGKRAEGGRVNFAGSNRRGGQPRKYVLTDAIREALLAEYQSHNSRELAARFGVPAWWIRHRAAELGVARTKEPRWSETDLDYLRANVHRTGWKRLATRLGRTIVAVKLKAKRLHLLKVAGDGYTAHRLAGLIGCDGHKVDRWIARGMLAATRRQTDRVSVQGGDAWLITDRAVREFLRDYPEEIDLRSVDRDWLFGVAFGPPRERRVAA